MSKITWKPGNMIYPLPAVLVSCRDVDGTMNIITVAWTGTVCTNPPMTYISLRPSRYSYKIIEQTKEFVINLSTEKLVRAADFCGVRSGSNFDKFKEMNLTPQDGSVVSAPLIKESPVNIECKVKDITPLGSHHMFLAEVVAVNVEDDYLDDNKRFRLDQSKPICYSHGTYYGLNKPLGTFGFSVARKKKKSK